MNFGFSFGFGYQGGGGAPIYNFSLPSEQDLSPSGLNLNTGTAYIRWAHSDVTPDANKTLFSIYGDANNSIIAELLTTTNKLQIIYKNGGSDESTVSLDIADYLPVSGTRTLVVAWEAGRFDIYINGVNVVYDTGITSNSTEIATIGLGQTVGGADGLGDTINEFKYYKQKLSHARAIALGKSTTYNITENYNANRNVFVILGQSNALGSGASQSRAENKVAFQNVIKEIKKNGQEATASMTISASGSLYPAIQQGSYVNFGALICDYLREETSNTWDMMNCARGSTGLVSGGSNGQWKSVTTGTQTVMSKLLFGSISMMLLSEKSFGPVGGLLWLQGETDANNSVTQENYEAALNVVLDEIDRYVSPAYKVIVGLHDKPASGYANWDTEINPALEAVATSRSITFVNGKTLDLVSGDDLHYEVDAYSELAQRVAAGLTGETIYPMLIHIPTVSYLDFRNYDDMGSLSSVGGGAAALGDVTITNASYNSSAFGVGLPGLIADDSDANVQTGSISANTAMRIYTACSVPASLSTTQPVIRFGTSGTNSYIQFNSAAGRNVYQRNEAGSNQNMTTTDWRNSSLALCYEWDSTSVFNHYSNELSVSGTFDPHDGYSTETVYQIMGLGSGNCNAGFGMPGFMLVTQDPYTNLHSWIMEELARQAGATLN